MATWLEALKAWNRKKGGRYQIPKKGSNEYNEVRKMMSKRGGSDEPGEPFKSMAMKRAEARVALERGEIRRLPREGEERQRLIAERDRPMEMSEEDVARNQRRPAHRQLQMNENQRPYIPEPGRGILDRVDMLWNMMRAQYPDRHISYDEMRRELRRLEEEQRREDVDARIRAGPQGPMDWRYYIARMFGRGKKRGGRVANDNERQAIQRVQQQLDALRERFNRIPVVREQIIQRYNAMMDRAENENEEDQIQENMYRDLDQIEQYIMEYQNQMALLQRELARLRQG